MMSRLLWACVTFCLAMEWAGIYTMAQTASFCGGISQSQFDGSISLIIRRQDSNTWPGKQAQFEGALDAAMNANSTTLYTIQTTVYHTTEIDQTDHTDLQVYIYAIVNPVGAMFPAEQLLTEARAAQLYIVAAAEVYFTLASVRVGAPEECEASFSSSTAQGNDTKKTDWNLLGIIIAIGATVLITSLIVIIMASRSSRSSRRSSQAMVANPGPYVMSPYVTGGMVHSPPPPPATTLAVDFGEGYDDKTMHTHL